MFFNFFLQLRMALASFSTYFIVAAVPVEVTIDTPLQGDGGRVRSVGKYGVLVEPPYKAFQGAESH